MSDALTELIRDANRNITPADRHAILDLIEQQAALILSLESRIAQQARTITAMCQQVADLERTVAPAVDAQPVAWMTKSDGYVFYGYNKPDRVEEDLLPLYASAQLTVNSGDKR